MKALPFLIACLSLISCGVRTPLVTAVTPLVAPPSAVVRAGDAEHEAAETPGEAAAFYLLKRTGGAPLEAEKLLAAKRHKDSMPAFSIGGRRGMHPGVSARDANVGTWQMVGPGNIGGRTRSLVVRPDDPNTIYAGAVGGGVWKTTDGGNTWNPLTDLLPSIGIGTLAMDPNSPDTLYAGTGEWFTSSPENGGAANGNSVRGAGIFKTTDGGATWTQLPATANPNFYYVNKLVVSPNNSQNLYAATFAGIVSSTDGGNTWKLVLSRSGDQYGCQDLVIRTDQTSDYLFAACAAGFATNPAIYRNVDAAGAGKWEIVFTDPRMARTTLALAPSSQGTIYAAVSSNETGIYNNALLGVYRSTSNGDSGSWTAQVTNKNPTFLNTLLFSNPTDTNADVCGNGKKDFTHSQGEYDNVIAVDPVNPNVVWVGGVDLFRSDDGGQNWGIASFWELYGMPQWAHGDHHVLVFSPAYDGVSNQTLFNANDGGVFRTDNALAATATGARAACAPYPTSVVWNNLNNGYAVTQFYHGAVYPGGAAYLGGTQDNNALRGSDAAGPARWSTPYPIGDGGFVAIDPTNPNNIFLDGTFNSILRSTDGGATFADGAGGIAEATNNFLFIAPMVMDLTQPKRLYFGGKTLWRTDDGAQSWNAASAPIAPADGSISTIAVSPLDPNQAIFGTSNGAVYRNSAAPSAGGATAWTASHPRSGYVSYVAFDPSQAGTVYAIYSPYKSSSAQSHVYKSTDGGANWTGIDGSGSTGLPDIPVFTILIDPQNSSNLYVGTDIGLFASTDGGATWARDVNPFADATTEILALDSSAGQSNLVAFTHGRGVWKTTLPGSGSGCQYAVSTNSVEFPATGNAGSTIQITTGSNCVWSLVADSSDFNYFSLSGLALGKGNGSVTVKAPFFNNLPRAHTILLQVQNQAIAVKQDAAQVAQGNDDISSAFRIGNLPAVVIGNNSSATESPSDPTHACTSSKDSKTVWFSVSPPAAGVLNVYASDTQANGADAGSVITMYTVVNGNPAQEFYCKVYPQTTTPAGGGIPGVSFNVRGGETFLIEVSATTSGAPPGASVIGGNITLLVTQ